MAPLLWTQLLLLGLVSFIGTTFGEDIIRYAPIVDLINDENKYHPKIPPKFDSETPVEVLVQMTISSIDSVNEDKMDYSLSVYLRQFWVDERLRYTPLSNLPKDVHPTKTDNASYGNDSDNVTFIYTHSYDRLELDSRVKSRVWFPDTYFCNEREAEIHHVTTLNELIHIFPNGTVFSSVRISLTLTCHMHLEKYPFDRQHCPIIIGSYGHTSRMITYKWHDVQPIFIKKGVELPTFDLTDSQIVECDETTGSLGDFSCIQAHLTLHRHYGYYIVQVYIPSILLVVLSWVNFWLDLTAVPARVSLSLLAVLTMTTMGVGAKSNLPPVSYVKAIDVWFSVCLVFVVAALLEFAFVNMTSRVQNRRLTMKGAVQKAIEKNKAKLLSSVKSNRSAAGDESTDRSTSPNSLENPPSLFRQKISKAKSLSQHERARVIDKVCRLVFPLTFSCFMVFYWWYYLTTGNPI